MPGGNHPVDIENFRGLNLTDDPSRVPPNMAIDLTDVEFDHQGIVKSRAGYSQFSSASATLGALHGRGDGILIAKVLSSNQMTAIGVSGSTIASNGVSMGQVFTTSIATLGTTSSNVTYVACNDNQLWKFDGTSWSSVVLATPAQKTVHAAVTPIDNRLALSCDNASQVFFSDPGLPEVYQANNYIYLTPGDGETISAMVTWHDYLFVFKQTKFFVFYGTSVDSSGQPIFNYRTFAGTGAMVCQGAAVAGRDGVYFLTNDGVYRTTGGEPTKVSTDIDLLFRHPATLFAWTGASAAPDQSARLGFQNDRLFISWDTGHAGTGPYASLVYYAARDTWSYWTLPAAHIINVPRNGTSLTVAATTSRAMFGNAITSSKVMAIDPTVTTDNGSAIIAKYRSGYFRVGVAASEATIRETQIVGAGTVGIRWQNPDFSGPANTATVITLGSGSLTTRGRELYRNAVSAEYHSYALASNGSGTAWMVTRLVPLVREDRGTGEATS